MTMSLEAFIDVPRETGLCRRDSASLFWWMPGLRDESGGAQQTHHAYCRFAPAVVALEAQRLDELHSSVERIRRAIAGAQLDMHGHDARGCRCIDQPRRHASCDTATLVRRR